MDALDHFPVNVMAHRELASIAELEKLGVKRVSFGQYASYAVMRLLKRISMDVLEKGSFS